MSRMQVNGALKKQQERFRIGYFITVAIALFLYYESYCIGLWGKKSVFLQYFLQCGCPAFTEEWRYPDQIDIVIPACRATGTKISPSGRFVLAFNRVGDSGNMPSYLLDTKEKVETPLELPYSDIYFLSDSLLYIFIWYGYGNEGGDHIYDLSTQTIYPIQRFKDFRANSMIDGYADLNKLAESLHDANQVYYLDPKRLIIALPKNIKDINKQGFLSGWFDISSKNNLNRTEDFLRQYNIDHAYIDVNFGGALSSPDGRFIARGDGIYLTATNQKIVDNYSFSWYDRLYSGQHLLLKSWNYDGSGAMYSQFLGPCLFEPFGLDGAGCIIKIPQPTILLKIPKKYLSPLPAP